MRGGTSVNDWDRDFICLLWAWAIYSIGLILVSILIHIHLNTYVGSPDGEGDMGNVIIPVSPDGYDFGEQNMPIMIP